MKNWLLAFGCLFLGLGLFYDAMPVELFVAISQLFSANSGSMHLRLVATDRVDLLQVSFLLIGIGLIAISIFLRRTTSRP